MNRTPFALLRNERGVALAVVAFLLFVLLGLAALAVDLGILYGARTEAQRTADAAALAGASILLSNGQDEVGARTTAIDYAARNSIRNEATVVLPGDVDVELDRGLVRVRVFRTENRGTAVPNVFARAIGFPTSNVSAMGAAIAGAGNSVRCPLPFVLVDRFWKSAERRLSDWTDPLDPTDRYVPGSRDEAPPPADGGRTGWGALDRGEAWRIYPSDASETPVAGYYYMFDPEGISANANTTRQWIGGCPDPSLAFTIGQTLMINNGRRVGAVNQGFDRLLGADDAVWNFGQDCPTRRMSDDCLTELDTGRIRPIIIVSPDEEALTRPGRQPITVENLAAVFVICQGALLPGITPLNVASVDDCDGSGPPGQERPVWIRFIETRGEMGEGDVPSGTTLVRVLRLVE